jgi:hypothetical protein
MVTSDTWNLDASSATEARSCDSTRSAICRRRSLPNIDVLWFSAFGFMIESKSNDMILNIARFSGGGCAYPSLDGLARPGQVMNIGA